MKAALLRSLLFVMTQHQVFRKGGILQNKASKPEILDPPVILERRNSTKQASKLEILDPPVILERRNSTKQTSKPEILDPIEEFYFVDSLEVLQPHPTTE